MGNCAVEDCSRKAITKGMCGMHNMRRARGADLNASPKGERYPKICTFPGCEQRAPSKGLCSTHYRQKWPQKNDAVNIKMRVQKMRAFLAHLKVERGCAVCGYNKFSGSLHFDHLNSDEKRFCIGAAASRGMKTVIAEIEKCQLLCVNCHSIRTQLRRESVVVYRPKILELRDAINNLKLEKGCIDCGYRTNTWALQFDHIDSTLKVAAVSTLVYSGNSIKVWEEVAKCEVRCGNCHMERTFGDNKETEWAEPLE